MQRIINSCDDNFMSQRNSGIKSKYEYESEPIGRGSYASVYIGYNHNKQKVAIKKININKISSKLLHKFICEMELSQNLKHINIIETYETFRTANNIYIVMELCDGETLYEYIQKNMYNINYVEREKEVLNFVEQIKNGLEYLKNKNIIHRDLKPKNILIKNNGNQKIIKIVDFGFAKFFENSDINFDGYTDLTNTFCGTPLYMAPELLIENKYNIKADLWSVGVIMYEMLYGTVPYDKPKSINELSKMMKNNHITFPEIYSEICIDLMRLLLMIDPTERIDWDIFFSHPWFTLTNNDKVTLFTDSKPKKSPIPELKISKPIDIPKKNKKDDLLDDYVIIDEDEARRIRIYHSQKNDTGSLIKILSDSYYYLFGNSPKTY
jgi:serine/threonine protein kinase